MFRKTKILIRIWLAAVVVIGALALNGSHAFAAVVTVELCAVPGTATLTGAFSVPIWGFGIPTTANDCSTATASLPGPLIAVNEGDVVTLTVHNALPAGHSLRLEAPGIAFNPGLPDAASGATVSLSFTAGAPGTYLYESGGDAGRQEAMGLYGALVVNSATVGQAYDNVSTAYDVSSVLVLSQVDPVFNNMADPNSFNMNNYLATYWLVNGKAYPDSAASSISAAAGQRILLRYLNAGYDNTSMMLLGMHQRVLARDGYLRGNPFMANSETIPAGGTEDAIAIMPATAAPSANGFPLYNRNLHVTNGSVAALTYAAPGGMALFIHAPAPDQNIVSAPGSFHIFVPLLTNR